MGDPEIRPIKSRRRRVWSTEEIDKQRISLLLPVEYLIAGCSIITPDGITFLVVAIKKKDEGFLITCQDDKGTNLFLNVKEGTNVPLSYLGFVR